MGAAARLRSGNFAALLQQAWWAIPFAAWTIPYPNPALRATVHLSFALPYAALAAARRHPPSSEDLAIASVATLVTVAALVVASVARAARSLVFAGSNAGVFELPIELDHRGEVRFGRLEGRAPSQPRDRSRREADASGAARPERLDLA